jgi:hypothetical protein
MVMRIFLSCLFLSAQLYAVAQMPLLYMKAAKSASLGALGKTATLFVVIENEKKADGAALVNAVKKYWKVGSVKYMSLLEFTEKFKSSSFDKSQLFLFNNISNDIKPKGAASSIIYTGYYLTNDPYALVNAFKPKHAPPYLFFSANSLYDSKNEPIDGYFDLMVKNFDHDVKFCMNADNFKKNKRAKKKNGVYYFTTPDTLKQKNMLLVKEQVTRQEKPKKEGKKGKKNAKQKVEYVTDAYTGGKKPIVVFPDDIAYAVKKADSDVLLYNGACVYSPADGSVLATKRYASGGVGPAFGIVSLLVSAASVAWVFQKMRSNDSN